MSGDHVQLAGKSVVVVGLGRSGVAASQLCLARGARVVATDAAPIERLSAPARALADAGAVLAVGGHDDVPWATVDLAVVSPGVASFAALEAAEARGVPVVGELELASRFVGEVPIVAIGGTNGKSTTTTLVAEMALAAGLRTFAGANLGTPLSEAVGAAWDLLVLEISSFQAERVPTFHPKVAALLNVTDDHLDRYPSFEAYAAAKGNVFALQTSDDVAVVPAGDARCAAQAARGGGRVVRFGAGGEVSVRGGELAYPSRGFAFPVASLRISGAHNLDNAAAAIACADAAGIAHDAIARALASFEGLAHRTVLVARVGGVAYYDDSKGTNVGASVAALAGLAEAKAVLIAGGRDKLGSYEPLVRTLASKGRGLVVIGEAGPRIADAARGVLDVERARTIDEAVRLAAGMARPGDAVLLSPACSSFDMFRDYKERGDAFATAVRSLAEETTR